MCHLFEGKRGNEADWFCQYLHLTHSDYSKQLLFIQWRDTKKCVEFLEFWFDLLTVSLNFPIEWYAKLNLRLTQSSNLPYRLRQLETLENSSRLCKLIRELVASFLLILFSPCIRTQKKYHVIFLVIKRIKIFKMGF